MLKPAIKVIFRLAISDSNCAAIYREMTTIPTVGIVAICF